MPGFDGTGPEGTGPMTGGGRGYCALPLRRTFPAFRWRRPAVPYGDPFYLPYRRYTPNSPDTIRREELDYLKETARSIQEDIRNIEERIKTLETSKD
jgi:hypothetical protein